MHTPLSGTQESAPFGAPDADEADLDPRAFVEFKGRRFRGGLNMNDADSSIRVITGGKGAGKTHYLRRLQAGLKANGSIYVDDWRNRYPSTDRVLWVWAESASLYDCRQRWSRIWRRAVVRCTISHLLHAGVLRSGVPSGLLERLRSAFFELTGSFDGPSTVVDQVEAIIDRTEEIGELDTWLRDPRWANLETSVGEVLDESRPMFFIVDGLDEQFEAAPSQWMDCQAGLLRQLLELRSDASVGRRLHVIVGVRDVVYSTTQEGEHANRHYETPGIRNLRWDADAIVYFLHRKLEALDPAEWTLDPRADDPVARWLGTDRVVNVNRDVTESITHYIVRHTRLIPRDIIQMGNALCGCIDAAVDYGDNCLGHDTIRETVSRIAKRCGDEQLSVVANHVTADLMPREALKHGFVDSYFPIGQAVGSLPVDDIGRAYEQAVLKHLRQELVALEVDRNAAEKIERFAANFRAVVGEVDIISMLWQHRLLGYIRGDRLTGRPTFYAAGRDDNLTLHLEHDAYALAPIVIDAVAGLRGVGAAVEL